jgi:[acyl-carrier-protein] S-malonyltransferase
MKIALVFPGQGSQSVGMLGSLSESFSQVRETYQEVSDALDYDLWELVQNGPEEELNKTHITQPAMLASGVAVWRIWQDLGGSIPVAMAGHSLGEYSALVSAGSISLSDAALLVADRGKFMQEAVPSGTGAMAAILGLDDDVVIELCSRAAEDEVVSAVNFNSPGQVVVAGNASAVERAVNLANEAGAKRAVILPVSVPSHCSLMTPAADRLAERLAEIEINKPSLPVYNNVDVKAEEDPDAIRTALKRQLFSPVRWVETINTFTEQGIMHIVECGAGKVLAGLNKRINRDMKAYTTQDKDSLQLAIEAAKGEG